SSHCSANLMKKERVQCVLQTLSQI
ncbi:hypothetical protein A5834_000481, partial [Enterococcus faecium]